MVGLTVSQVWQGYAARLFLSFGNLTPTTYARRNGTPGRPRGEFELTNVDSLSNWTILLNGQVLATSESRARTRENRLRRLVGRRLLSVQIDEGTRSTLLTFTKGLVLRTETMRNCRERRPHWLLRLSKKNWPPVILNGTSSRWRGMSGYDELVPSMLAGEPRGLPCLRRSDVGLDLETFREDRKTVAAVERKLLLIREAAIRLGEDADRLCPGLPGHKIRGIGN